MSLVLENWRKGAGSVPKDLVDQECMVSVVSCYWLSSVC